MGTTMVRVLLWVYLIIAAVFVYERDWGRVRYFVGAAILSWGVITMK